MNAVRRFNLPDPGEGLTEAEIVTWRVKAGDVVKVNDIVVEIETAKSLVELPVPFAGTVAELLVAEGDTVEVGRPIIAVDTGVAAGPGAVGPPSGSRSGSGSGAASGANGDIDGADPGLEDGIVGIEPGMIGGPAPGGRTSVLVGYGPRESQARRRPRVGTGAAAAAVTTTGPDSTAAGHLAASHLAVGPGSAAITASGSVGAPDAADTRVRVLAKPLVRKYAKDLGVDLTLVRPSVGEVVTRADVDAYRSALASWTPGPSGVPIGDSGDPRGAGGASGGQQRETRIPVKGVRKATAAAMVASAFTAPHVTEFVTVDVTRTMRLVRRLRQDPEFAEVKVSPLLVVAKALLIAARRNPGVNASWDEGAGEIVLKHYVNLGIAAATPRGLVVPNVKDADRLTLRELADELSALTATAREGRTPPAAMTGGTLTITNVGVFGIDTGTPILNPGEAAILAFGAVRRMPWVVRATVRPRWVTTLALSFDHRLVDGELGSRFLADVAAILERPDQALVWA